jgi:hypothetical protein
LVLEQNSIVLLSKPCIKPRKKKKKNPSQTFVGKPSSPTIATRSFASSPFHPKAMASSAIGITRQIILLDTALPLPKHPLVAVVGTAILVAPSFLRYLISMVVKIKAHRFSIVG